MSNVELMEREMTAFKVETIRNDFPILAQQANGHPLVYLDNAATAQKPQCVIDCLNNYYEHYNANIHRGVHCLSERATFAFEQAREKARAFINARSTKEIIFVRGTTEAINLVAQSYGRSNIQAGDEILITEMEHHSNIVPWQLLCEQTGATLKVVPMNDNGEISLQDVEALLNKRTKLVAIVHISNSLGTINPVKQVIDLAHANNTPVLIDGAQAAPHTAVDVQALDCDFYTISSHKVYGPTGVGVLYGKQALLDAMPPYQGGGEMIQQVRFEKSTYNELPHKFEAGTPHIAGAIAFGAALDYIQAIGLDNIAAYEHELLEYATAKIAEHSDITVYGQAQNKASILSFTLANIHAHDLGTILDQQGVAIRAGHHCTMPVMQHFGVAATARASFAFYNTKQEIDILFSSLQKARDIFAVKPS